MGLRLSDPSVLLVSKVRGSMSGISGYGGIFFRCHCGPVTLLLFRIRSEVSGLPTVSPIVDPSSDPVTCPVTLPGTPPVTIYGDLSYSPFIMRQSVGISRVFD